MVTVSVAYIYILEDVHIGPYNMDIKTKMHKTESTTFQPIQLPFPSFSFVSSIPNWETYYLGSIILILLKIPSLTFIFP